MIGTTVSHYRILEKLGEGGMGVVYKAHDLKLDRFVALKFLPGDFRPTQDELTRFQQEARALSSLSHPHVATIFDLDHYNEDTFIVLEFLPGGTLKQKVRELSTTQQQMPLEQVVEKGIQMAQGLAHAHRHGIIHRDIKTDNMMLTEDGEVKITDFGLAKLRGIGQLTRPGSVVGTAAYMSPEQTRGENLDHRSDIFSLGIVLFELATGQLPFRGDHEAAIGYAIVHEDPLSPKSLRSDIPPSLENIIFRCLEKERSRRFQGADEIVTELRKVQQQLSASPAASPIPSRLSTKKMPWIVGTSAALSALAGFIFAGGSQVRLYVFIFIVVAALVGALLLTVRRRVPLQPKPLYITLKQLTYVDAVEEYPAWSQDGNRLVFCREVQGYRKIFLKNLTRGNEIQLTKGAADDIQPAWSRDGRSILFVRSHQPNGKLEPGDIFSQFEGGDIWSLDLESGKESKLVDNAFNPSYSPDGSSIAIDASWAGPRRIWVVDSRGRNPRQVSSDVSEAVVHVTPRWSPDGTQIVFQNVERVKFDIRIVDVKSGEMNRVTNDMVPNVFPVWSPSGKEIYLSSFRSGGLNVWRIPISDDGTTISRAQQLTTGAGQDIQPAISPDGKHLAFSVVRLNADIWRLPVSPETGVPTGEPQPFIVSTREESRGAWSPDGGRVAFNSDRNGEMNIWVYSVVDGSLRQLTEGYGGDYQPNWSPDGKWIAFFSARSGDPDIWTVDVASGKLKQLTKNPSLEINPFYSPDGRYIAYHSDAAGRLEPWVMRSDGTAQRRLADMEVMGHFMRWSSDGTSVIFRSPNPSKPGLWSISLHEGALMFVCVPKGGSHISYSPNGDLIMDVVDHKELWVTPVRGGDPKPVFKFDDPQVRIDYPVWSWDGRWVLFDRVRPQGGNIWMIEGL